MRNLTWLVLTAFPLIPAQAERLPVEDFSHEEAFYGMELSPDGKVAAYEESIGGEDRIFFRDMASGKKLQGIELAGTEGAWVHSQQFFWVNNQRLMFTMHGRWAAMDRDGTHLRNYLGDGVNPLYLFRDEKEGLLLMDSYQLAIASGMRHHSYYVPDRPRIMKINPRLGISMLEVENPGNVVAWGINPQGVATVAVEIKGTQYRAVYSASGAAPWVTLNGMDWTDPLVWPLGFSADGKTLYVSRISPTGTWGLYPYDLNKRQLGALLLGNERYDIIPGRHSSALVNNNFHQTLVFDRKTRELLGVRYMTEYPCTLWIDAAMAKMQTALDEALPQKINTIVSMSDDRQQMTVFSWTASDPGTYYHFDVGAQKLEKLVAAMPWIHPEKMADVAPVRFKARDGVLISGYITFPKGVEPKHLPLVVLAHNSPWMRDTWSFNSSVQFLANRGYAVLQVNARGSSGYGEPFRNLAKKEVGAQAQLDLADGVRWAIRHDYADPARVGVMGIGSFGGYSALMNLALEPELYCCGIASAPYTDMVKIVDKSEMDPDEYAFYTEWIGDPAAEPGKLRASSPLYLAASIKASVLLIHDNEDDDWFFNQTKAMAAALKKAGREVQFNTKYSDRHYGYERHAKWLAEIEDFLTKHMPASAPPANAVPAPK